MGEGGVGGGGGGEEGGGEWGGGGWGWGRGEELEDLVNARITPSKVSWFASLGVIKEYSMFSLDTKLIKSSVVIDM